jgi:hypothetical protein
LRDIVEENVAMRTDEDRRRVFAQKHNARTILAVWAVDICVGMRATNHLYLHASEYDETTRMGSIYEKGAFRPFQLCIRGTEILATHDRYLSSLAGFGLPPSTRQMPCYFVAVVNQKLVPIPVTPSSIREHLGDSFRFDANWARRLIKTLGIEEGLPAIYTDAYCDHAYRGEERYHRFASFDPVPYFEAITKFTEGILEDLNIAPIGFDPSFLGRAL